MTAFLLFGMKVKHILFSSLIVLLEWITASSAFSESASPVTLTAEITVTNSSDKDVNGYVQRLSIPVSGHMQQKLVGIRYDYPEEIQRKRHASGDSEYVEFRLDIPANSFVKRQVHFDLLISDYDYKDEFESGSSESVQSYLEPAEYIESDSDAIVEVAKEIERTYDSDEDRLKAAFMLPQKIINYHVQPTKGALSALETGKGDCTEFAAVFVAVARAMGYPARMTADFLFTVKKEFSQPNHHSAEVYFKGLWIPVDPNLALDPGLGYGFGVGKKKKVVLTRDFNWVWSNSWPKGFNRYVQDADVKLTWLVH